MPADPTSRSFQDEAPLYGEISNVGGIHAARRVDVAISSLFARGFQRNPSRLAQHDDTRPSSETFEDKVR